MMDEESADTSTDRDGLRGAQRDLRDAFVAADSGLFVMRCVPGAGKSYTVERIAAEIVIERAAAGHPAPEYGLCVVSFGKEDAATITPGVVAWIRRLVETDATDAAARLDATDAERVVRQVRAAADVGTVDGLIREVFTDVASEVGFDGMPAVGEEGRLRELHADSVAAVRTDAELADAVARLDAAYGGVEPDEDADPEDNEVGDDVTDVGDDVLAGLLDDLRTVSRQRRLSPAEIQERLRATVMTVYDGGPPATADGLREAIRQYNQGDVDTDALEAPTDDEWAELLAADRTLHEAWLARIDDLCTVFEAYLAAYEERAEERGVISHADCAHYLADYLAGDQGDQDDAVDPRRRRILERYRDRLQDVLVDEAQDVSRVQHDALAPLVTPDCRVLLAGDLRQCIYTWREAHPEILRRAVDERTYFGIEWAESAVVTTERSYRCRPGIAGAVNAAGRAVFRDRARGGASSATGGHVDIEAHRDAIDDPNVHVAAFRDQGAPGTDAWVEGTNTSGGEARALARLVADGIRNGRFDDRETDGQPRITVLFRARRHMEGYADAFEAFGLSVRTASDHLFGTPAVRAVLATVAWLAEPADDARCYRLLAGALDIEAVADACSPADCTLTAARTAVDGDVRALLDALAELREAVARRRTQPAAVLVQDVIDALDLPTDPLDIEPDTEQRLSNLDRLVALVRDWEGSDRYDAAQLHELFAPLLDEPKYGPLQPPLDETGHDVVFKTVHQAKGDEDDVVVLADPTVEPTWFVQQDRLLTTGNTLALAPPENVLRGEDSDADAGTGADAEADGDSEAGYDVPCVDGGLYTPGGPHCGLRWVSTDWVPTDDGPKLTGPPGVRKAVRGQVAEFWRLLFVAVSRARNHLAVPLSNRVCGEPHDRWSETLREAFELGAHPARAVHEASGPPTFDLAVNQAGLVDNAGTPDRSDVPLSPAADGVPEPPWAARFVRPSTIHPLANGNDEDASPASDYVLDHLLGRSLHSASGDVNVPLPFDTMGPEEVGQFVHGVVADAARRRLPVDALRDGDDRVEEVIADRFANGPGVSDAERDAIRDYLTGTVFPQLADTALWERVDRAAAVHTEVPLERVHRVNGLDIEINGKADLILVDPDGTRHVEDLKTGLAATESETADRYRTQTALYAWMLAADPGTDAPVIGHVTTVGEEQGEQTIVDPVSVATRVLSALVADGES